MRATTAYRISLGGAIVVLLLALFGFQPAPPVCGNLATDYAPVIAEELVRSVADLQAIFGGGPSACRAAIADHLNLITWIDSLAFIPAYGVFLLFFFIALAPRDRPWARAGFILSAVAVVADYAENLCLFQVTAAPDVAGLALAVLPWATGVKWLTLGIAGAVGGRVLMRAGWLNYPAAALCAIGLVGTVLAIANPHLFGKFASNAVTLSWIVFLIVDIRGALWRGSAVAELQVEDRAG
jgi:hypothetical protein